MVLEKVFYEHQYCENLRQNIERIKKWNFVGNGQSVVTKNRIGNIGCGIKSKK